MRKTLSLLMILMLGGAQVFSQSRTVTVKVTDETQPPLSGVSVIAKGTNNGTITESDGTLSIKLLIVNNL